ncbi:SMP-30/gluconolactonase/LRE family protein [Congregibacter sp.]|uniref:SMP-30/gluconolactonase/LRE family protein n=1 Tax=Congregibacter sp. TaxID=2744308 RepID=UPI00385DD92D
MRNVFAILLSVLMLSTPAAAGDGRFIAARTDALDDRFFQFIEPGRKIEVLAPEHEFGWAEGPIWVTQLNSLLLSDVAADTIYQWSAEAGLSIYLRPSGHAQDDSGHAWRGSNGLALDQQGKLVLAQQGNRTLSRMLAPLNQPAANYQVLAQRYQGMKINSPNDLIVHSSGDIYFTDPPYGLSGFENSPDRELDFFGVFRLSPEGRLSAIDTTLAKPNGIALSPDQQTLFVSNSAPDGPHIRAIALDSDGSPLSSRLFFDASSTLADGPGSTDGMAMHASGYLFISIADGLALLSPQGELVGTIALGQVTNLAFDDAFSYLYITSPQKLFRLAINPLVTEN